MFSSCLTLTRKTIASEGVPRQCFRFYRVPLPGQAIHLLINIPLFLFCWREAYTHPIPKKGDWYNPSVYYLTDFVLL